MIRTRWPHPSRSENLVRGQEACDGKEAAGATGQEVSGVKRGACGSWMNREIWDRLFNFSEPRSLPAVNGNENSAYVKPVVCNQQNNVTEFT